MKTLTPKSSMSDLIAAVQELQKTSVAGGLQMHENAGVRTITYNPPIERIYARITAYDSFGDGIRWVYSWTQVKKSTLGYGWVDVPLGRSGDSDAYNFGEEPDRETAYTPIPVDSVVQLWVIYSGTAYEYWFGGVSSAAGGGEEITVVTGFDYNEDESILLVGTRKILVTPADDEEWGAVELIPHLTVVTGVTWDGTELKQTTINILPLLTGNASESVIDTPTSCT